METISNATFYASYGADKYYHNIGKEKAPGFKWGFSELDETELRMSVYIRSGQEVDLLHFVL